MFRRATIYCFPVSRDYRYRLGDRKFRLGSGGVRALKLLAQIVEHSPQPGDTGWLLPLRDRIREIERLTPRGALTLVVDRTEHERLRCFAVWLRGRCGGTLGTSKVARFSTASDPALRKEVTRCLKRMDAWAALRKIADTDSDSRIRRMATQFPSESHATRLTAYSQHIPRRIFVPSKPQLVVSPGVHVGRGQAPKPGWLIRRILERIHRLVGGSAD